MCHHKNLLSVIEQQMLPRCTIDGMILRALRYYFSERNGGQDAAGEADTTPMDGVNWAAYAGRWYEWARYETPFEYGLDGVYTEYEATGNGKVRICNYGTDTAGNTHQAKAHAKVKGEGKLSVSFIPILRFLSTPYHVLYVNDSYTAALVSNASGSCLWLLGRTACYGDDTFEELLNEARQRGFRTDTLRLTRHTC